MPEITEVTSVVKFLLTEASIKRLKSSLSCSKQLFGKVPGRPASTLKKDSTLDVLLGNIQKFSDQLFFQNTENSNSLFLEHRWTPFDK